MRACFDSELSINVTLTSTFPFEIRKHAAFYSYEKVPSGISSKWYPIESKIKALEIAFESNLS